MNTNIQILPGIKYIGWVDCRKLQKNVALAAVSGMNVPVLTDIHPIPFFDEPACECKTSKEGAGYQDNASLKFLTDRKLKLGQAVGFVVVDVNDKAYLIGAAEPPYPIIEYSLSTGRPSGDSAGYAYEVKHTAIKSLITCII